MKAAAGILAFGAVAFAAAGPASAQCPDSPQNCDVDVEAVTINPSTPPAAPAPASAPATQTDPIRVLGKQQLPVTGTEAGTLALGGVVLLAAGGALVWRSRASAVSA